MSVPDRQLLQADPQHAGVCVYAPAEYEDGFVQQLQRRASEGRGLPHEACAPCNWKYYQRGVEAQECLSR